MPCLNEEASVGICVRKAWAGIHSSGLRGEVIVSDNGSTDRSVAFAEAAGARVVHAARRGYGNAYLKGFSAARGRIIVMGDSDDSYDFTVIPDLIKPIDEGYDYVLGSRFAGQIRPDAMSWSHRRIGNPVLTTLLNLLFGLRVSDAHSGFRALTRTALAKLDLSSEGMELASEIVVKAAMAKLRTTEIPITYHPRIGESKLESLRDGWRHLRFLLLLSPDYLFVLPGVAFTMVGLLGQFLLLAAVGGPYAIFEKIMLALATVAGSQLLALGLFAKVYTQHSTPGQGSRIADWIQRTCTIQRGLLGGISLFVIGLVMLTVQFARGIGPLAAGGLAASVTILGLTSLVLGGAVCFDAFFVNLLSMRPSAPPVMTDHVLEHRNPDVRLLT